MFKDASLSITLFAILLPDFQILSKMYIALDIEKVSFEYLG